MSPANAAFRFALEVAALVAAGVWGWTRVEGWPRYVLAVGVPLAMACAWGLFNVPGDPSRSGRAPVRVPGAIRLLLELVVLGFGGYAVATTWHLAAGVTFAGLVLVHYVLSRDRVAWLLRS